jgi:hypothetical protein
MIRAGAATIPRGGTLPSFEGSGTAGLPRQGKTPVDAASAAGIAVG